MRDLSARKVVVANKMKTKSKDKISYRPQSGCRHGVGSN
jgi:hypothetical protein